MSGIKRNISDLNGKRFGKLVVICDSGKRANDGKVILKCKCDCGNYYYIRKDDIKCKNVISCGCHKRRIVIERNKYRCGKKSDNWKGGKIIQNGYIFLYRPNHPYCNANGYVKRSRLRVERRIGRYLSRDEFVHHKNENRKDDRYKNLEIMSIQEHCKHHKMHLEKIRIKRRKKNE